jgi:hypothetical protein
MKDFIKQSKGFFSFVIVAAAILFWITEPGLKLLTDGFTWLPFVQAPLLAALFAFVNFGKPGKKLFGTDDQGNMFLGGFWSMFIFLTLILLGAGFLVVKEM